MLTGYAWGGVTGWLLQVRHAYERGGQNSVRMVTSSAYAQLSWIGHDRIRSIEIAKGRVVDFFNSLIRHTHFKHPSTLSIDNVVSRNRKSYEKFIPIRLTGVDGVGTWSYFYVLTDIIGLNDGVERVVLKSGYRHGLDFEYCANIKRWLPADIAVLNFDSWSFGFRQDLGEKGIKRGYPCSLFLVKIGDTRFQRGLRPLSCFVVGYSGLVQRFLNGASIPVEVSDNPVRLVGSALSASAHFIEGSLHGPPLLKGKKRIQTVRNSDDDSSYSDPMIRILPKSRLYGWIVCVCGISIIVAAVLSMGLRFWIGHGGFGTGVVVGLVLLSVGYFITYVGLSMIFAYVVPAHSDSPLVAMSLSPVSLVRLTLPSEPAGVSSWRA